MPGSELVRIVPRVPHLYPLPQGEEDPATAGPGEGPQPSAFPLGDHILGALFQVRDELHCGFSCFARLRVFYATQYLEILDG